MPSCNQPVVPVACRVGDHESTQHVRLDVKRNRETVRRAMVAHMRFGDRICFASVATLMSKTGLSRNTVRKHRDALIFDGELERCEWTGTGRGPRTVVLRVPRGVSRIKGPERRLTPTSVDRKSRTRTFPTRFARRAETTRIRRRSLAEDLQLWNDSTDIDRPVTARDILGALVDTMAIHDVPVTSRAKGMIGRQAKELLADGFKPEVVLAAAVLAYRRGEPHVAHLIAADIALAQAGQGLTRKEYAVELGRAAATLHPSRAEQLVREAYARKGTT